MALDSAKLGSNGVFSFSGKRPESPEFYRLRLDNKVINFSVDSIETLTVKAGANDFATGYSIEGSENNTKIKELVLLLADLQNGWISWRITVTFRPGCSRQFGVNGQ